MKKGTGTSLILGGLVRRPGRTAALLLLTALLSLTVCGGGLVLRALRGGLASLENRLGADIIVMPARAALKTDLDKLFLQGTIGAYYMQEASYNKLRNAEGIGQMSTQVYLASLRADCCSMPIQVIGFDPATDFVIQPWVQESGAALETGRVLVGCKVNAGVGETIRLYNVPCPVAGRLAETGTGLDTAVYCTLDTIRQLISASEAMGFSNGINGDPEKAVSAVYIRVRDGVDVDSVANWINVHVRKVEAVRTRSMVTGVADSLGGVSRALGILMAAVGCLVWAILCLVFALTAGGRRREFAALRVCGLSRGQLSALVFREALLISLAGAVLGAALGLALTHAFSTLLESALGLPFLLPGAGEQGLLALGTVLGCLAAGPLAAALSARRLIRADTALILREG